MSTSPPPTTISTVDLIGCPPLPTVNHRQVSYSLLVLISIECRPPPLPYLHPQPDSTQLNLQSCSSASGIYPSSCYPSCVTAVVQSTILPFIYFILGGLTGTWRQEIYFY